MKQVKLLLLAFAVLLASCSTPYDAGTSIEPSTVYIYSATSTPTESEKIVLKNNSGASADIGAWTLGDLNNSTAYSIPVGTIMASGAFLTFQRSTLGFQINDDNETLYLKNSLGTTIDTWSN